MGLINWLLGKDKATAKQQSSARSTQTDIHATLADATRPFSGAKPSPGAPAPVAAGSPAQRLEQRRSERNARRELLFQVVRESMVRVGVLSSAFKFKVLALDQRGRTFLVMIDLSAEFAGETAKLAEIEALIAQSAKNRYELVVQAVYWRFYEAVSSSSGRTGASSAPVPLFGMPSHTNSRPAPLSEVPYPVPPVRVPAVQPVPTPRPAPSATLPVRPAPVPTAKPTAIQATGVGKKTGADPLEHEEVEAFKRALASGAQPGMSIPVGGTPASATAFEITQAYTSPHATANAPAQAVTAAATAAAAAAAKAASLAAINNKLLLTGYEDTELPDPDAPVLSTTQYGELR
jgi:hypothetical protein